MPQLIWAVHKGSDGQDRARACSGGVCAGEVTRTTACGGDSPALPLGGAPGHQHDHKLVHYVEGVHAHVTEGSRGAIMPRRRPAPEGGSAAAPASSWMRQSAQDEGKLGGGFFAHHSRTTKTSWPEWKMLRGRGSATAADQRRSGVVGAQLLRAPETKTCGSTSSVSPWRTQEARKESGGANPLPMAMSSRRQRGTEAAAKVERLLERTCLESEGKGEAGARA
jgi:hypothetical protein